MTNLHDARVEAACAAFTCETREEWEEFDEQYKNDVRLNMTDALAAADAVVTVEMIAEVLNTHHHIAATPGPHRCTCGVELDGWVESHRSHQADAILALLTGEEA